MSIDLPASDLKAERTAGPAPCSDLTRRAGDDPAGSGTAFSTFLLLDYRGPWGHDAAADASRDLLTPHACVTAHAAPGLRTFAIRPVRDRRSAPTAPGYAGTVGHDARLAVLAELPDDRAVTEIASGTLPGGRTDSVLIGVCTNARRDRCCAVRGRPVATALQAEFGDGTITEISHLGGHRYAATLLALPFGYSYGFLDPTAARQVVLAALEGLVHPENLRGRSDLPPAAQAADAFWRRQIGLAPVEAVRIDSCAVDGDDAIVQASVSGSGERMHLHREHGPAISDTACGGKPITTGRWVAELG